MSKSNARKFIVFILLISICVGLCACSFPQPKPKDGIWYCEELRLEIDFFVYNQQQTADCAKLHNPDGTTRNMGCHFLYGGGVNIGYRVGSLDPDYTYLAGDYRYKKETWFREESFTITAYEDGRTYIFERIDN